MDRCLTAPLPAPSAHTTDIAMVEATGLVKRYGDVTVVDGIDLRVERGEIFGLLCSNGAGKTTAVECLQGLRRPDAGTLRVAVMRAGRVVAAGTPAEVVARHGPATVVRFTLPPGFDGVYVAALPGVDRVERDGPHIRVTGEARIVAPVCAATLDASGSGPPDLHVRHPDLDDALVHLIGAAA